MKTTSESYISNATVMLAAAAGLAFLGGLINDWLLYIGFGVSLLFVVLWSLNFNFNRFMDSKVKLYTYVRYDFKNDPIHYVSVLFMWGVVLFWFYRDYSESRQIGFDVILGLYSLYIVSCVMVLWGYYKDYDRLP